VPRPIALLACAAVLAGAVPAAAAQAPVVWIQAGHQGPREPGYRAQTGAGSGPFGSEMAFNERVAASVVRRLRSKGVDARRTPGLVTPWGAEGATFVSIHHDTPDGSAAIGHAIFGANENWYHGEGGGTASPVPYGDSARHRKATTVSRAVERRSRALANRLSKRFGRIRTTAFGAFAPFGGVVPRDGNVRMMRFYGYYRTRAQARILIECGAGTRDDAFLSRTELIGAAITGAVVEDLRARGLRG